MATEPDNKKIGLFVCVVNGAGYDESDDGVAGKCNETGFYAFRKHVSSFARPLRSENLVTRDSTLNFSVSYCNLKIIRVINN